jgi:hypothetical protein
VARQIERGLSLRGPEVAAGLGASAAIRAAFADFFCEFDLLLAPTVPCTAWPLAQLGPKIIDGKEVNPRLTPPSRPSSITHAFPPFQSLAAATRAAFRSGFKSSREEDETGCCCVPQCALRLRYTHDPLRVWQAIPIAFLAISSDLSVHTSISGDTM